MTSFPAITYPEDILYYLMSDIDSLGFTFASNISE